MNVLCRMSRSLFLIVLLILWQKATVVMAQEPGHQDTVVQVYVKMEKAAQRTWFTTALYDLFFKPIAFTGERDGYQYRKLAHQPYDAFEGEPIRRIRVVTLDPFGYDVYDTTEVPTLGTERFGNAIHAKTLTRTVDNLLLFSEGQLFDSLLVKESERLIRQELYIQEVFFFPQRSGEGLDSVDILIRGLDSWSILPEFGISPTRVSVGLNENNLGGLNHVFRAYYTRNYVQGRNALETDYTIRNIRNSYVNTHISYRLHEIGDHVIGLQVERPFYSPVTRWAGGISVQYADRTDTVFLAGGISSLLSSVSVPQDYWAARSWQLSGGKTADDRATNLIVSARVSAVNFINPPPEPYNALQMYRDRALFLAGVGLSTRRYVRDRYIFNYGYIEDVPMGRSYGVVAGYELQLSPRWYVGAHYAWGRYYRWGYFSTRLDYGNFFRSGAYEQGMVRLGISYFTGSLELGRWKFRQFVKPELTIGISRLDADVITLNEGQRGIRGFSSTELSGMHRLLITLQTQSYAPWKLLGFQFGPYLVASMGMLGDSESGFSDSRPYWMVGLGVLVNNHYLVFENFELSVAFYPFIPGTGENNGSNVLIGNTFRTTDFGFPDFGLGRPEITDY